MRVCTLSFSVGVRFQITVYGGVFAYAERRGACPMSHTDWGNAPMNFRLTATNTLRRAFAYKSP